MGGRLGVRLLIVVLLSVIAIETAILIPSYLGYQRELQDRLEHVGRAIVVTALKPRNHESDEDRLNYARLAARFSELSGGSLYRLDGSLIGHFGEKPDLSPDDANGRPMLARMTGNGKNLDVVWSAAELDLPVTVVGRMDAAWIEPELNAFVWRIAMLSLLITVFAGSVVMVIFNRVVLRRILRLRRRMAVASEDAEAAVATITQTPSRDELDDLAQEFNGMIERIAQDIAEHKLDKDALKSSQRRVEKRTKDLEQANIQLQRQFDETKHAEESLRKSEENFRAIFEHSPAAVYLKDVDGKYLLVNSTFTKFYGPTQEEALGKTFAELFPTEVSNTHDIRDDEVLKKRTEIQWERVNQHVDGLNHPTWVLKFPIFDINGEITAICGINTDIAECKSAEGEVVSSQAKLAAILEIAPEGVITIDHNMTITMFNLTAERIFGYSAEEIMGQRFDRLMPERFRRGHGDLVETFSRSSETARYMDQRGDIYGLRKDGTEFPAGASVSKLILGPDRFYTVMIRDITAQKRILDELISAKNEAEIANLTKSEFLASMSHELRTPLNAILGFSDIMRNEYLGPLGADQYLEYVEDIHSSGDHLLSLLSDLLDISAIEAGKMAIKKQVLNVEEIAAESLKIISLNAQGKVISLVSSIAGQLPDLLADKRSIKQILINLLTNAVKYTPEGGEISLTVAATESEITFTVADNGQGIPPDQLPYLTDPLTRYEKDPMHANEGWGLGLAITHSLVGLHQGNMKIESETGVGTTVIVTILLNTP